MKQDVIPEIRAATQALEKQLTVTETDLGRGWRKAIAAVGPKQGGQPL